MEAVRRRRSGESAEEIAVALGRTSRWVRKWAARADEEPNDDRWAEGRSRAPLSSPTRTSDELRQLIVDARKRLAADPRGQYGALAVAWQLRRMGIEPIPNRGRSSGSSRPRAWPNRGDARRDMFRKGFRIRPGWRPSRAPPTRSTWSDRVISTAASSSTR